ncbi:hypothetical protein EIMP300_89960 [Escherichia coli]|uniref:ABC transporter type 1 GsiC-like N-terminal domain-containing protein n=1 Tax=Escherichia coli TaxID=562 RepID=A0A8S0G459_ECOLX|nr:hypothetical protein EIMP300_89960 [Escherichia coli]
MSVVFSTRARWRGKRPLLALLQGLFTVALTLLGLLLITFALSALSPVDRVLQIVGDHASQSTYDQVRHQLGLDQPLAVQFWHYLMNLAHGDLGIASSTGQPVLQDLLSAFPATIELATPWRLLSVLLSASLRVYFAPVMSVLRWISPCEH